MSSPIVNTPSKRFIRTVTLHGGVCGPIWCSTGAACGRPIRHRLHRDCNLRDELKSIMASEDGDFQCADFTADTEIVITDSFFRNDREVKTRTRYVALLALPSVSDMATDEYYSYDFGGYDFGGEED